MKQVRSNKQLYKTLRETWTLKPVTKVKQSGKVYTRKTKHSPKDGL